jgi:hypothetical protein
MHGDELAESVAGLVHESVLDQPSDVDGQLSIFGERGDNGGASAYSGCRDAVGGVDRSIVDRPRITTH